MDVMITLNTILILFFIYLVLSMMATVFQEFVAGLTNRRARNLKAAIGLLLGNPKLDELAKHVFNHSLITGMTGMTGGKGGRLLANLPNSTFADVIIDHLKCNPSQGSPWIQSGLAALWHKSGKNESVFRNMLIDWYETAMVHESDRYKKSAQQRLLFYGFILAVLLNVDTLQIGTFLLDPANSAQTAALAAKISDQYAEMKKCDAKAPQSTAPSPEGAPPSVFNDTPAVPGRDCEHPSLESDPNKGPAPKPDGVSALFANMKLPIGWSTKAACSKSEIIPVIGEKLHAAACPDGFNIDKKLKDDTLQRIYVLLSWMLGWFMTALAISLGAQFWFDTLGKVIALRSSTNKTS